MRSIASIVFILLFLAKGLFPFADLGCELKKLPSLFQHFEEHQEECDNSFWEFLAEHYFDMSSHEENHSDKHEDLPFQGDGHNCHANLFHPAQSQIDLPADDVLNSTLSTFYKASLSLEFSETPFQPPQL